MVDVLDWLQRALGGEQEQQSAVAAQPLTGPWLDKVLSGQMALEGLQYYNQNPMEAGLAFAPGAIRPTTGLGPIYHRTTADIANLRDFDVSKANPNSVWGQGLYATLDNPNWNPGHLAEGKVLSGYVQGDILDMTKPLAVTDQARFEALLGRKFDALPLMTLEHRYGSVANGLRAAGYTGAIHEGPGGTGRHVVVFDPANINPQGGGGE
jgi:hypothetical protein